MTFEEKTLNLLSIIPKEQKERVFGQRCCDIDTEFIGFIEIYEYLSLIIPKNFTIVDLGCAYNPQCFYFINHKKYIAVDISECEKFKTDNCEIYQKTISDFIKNDLITLNLKETFAICNYVPSWGDDNMKLVRESFINVFVYYPYSEKVLNFKF
jgi:hypothetical protein